MNKKISALIMFAFKCNETKAYSLMEEYLAAFYSSNHGK